MERDSLPPCKKWHNPTGSLWLQGLHTHTLPFYFSAERLEVLKSPDQDHVGWKHWFEMIYTPGLKVRMTVWEIPMPILDDISQLQLRRQNHEIMTQMECRCTCKIHKKEQKRTTLTTEQTDRMPFYDFLYVLIWVHRLPTKRTKENDPCDRSNR